MNESEVSRVLQAVFQQSAPPGGWPIVAGDKVILRYEDITGLADWPRLNERYKTFVEENKDRVFTAQATAYGPSIFVLEEEPLWLFLYNFLKKVS